MFSGRSRSSVRLKDSKQREDINAGGGSVGGGAFTRWLREFRRETYKVNANAGGNGGNSGGTYHSTAEDGRRRHSFNAHDKSAAHLQQVDQRPDGAGPYAANSSRAACRRANSTAAPRSRTRKDGPFSKANCTAVATIRELPSSCKENRSVSNGHLDRHNSSGSAKSGQTSTRMTETRDGHAIRHKAPLPPAEVKDSSCGHEKFPSWPTAAPAVVGTSGKSNGMPAATVRKSWAEEQTTTNNNCYPKDQPPPIVRPYPKRLSNGLYTQQLKTVMERCEKGGKPEALDRERSMRAKGGYAERLQQIGEKNFCVPLSTAAAATDPADPLKPTRLTQAQLEKYSRAYDDSPHRETDEYSSCFDGSDSALSSHLTKEELEHYTRIYEEKSSSQISLSGKVAPSHQHQTSYAQSEGYHSYVSSTDSTSTPFLDRLRRENESVVVVATGTVSKDLQEKPSARGRDSSASSGSSSETLKWHGSNSDLSTVSSAGTGHRSGTTQHIAHSAKVSTPQRHHSESVHATSAAADWSGGLPQDAPGSRNGSGHQRNFRKLFPVSTYTVQPAAVVVQDEKTSPKSPPALSVAERISELEKQQQQACNKFAYFDPEKRLKVPDHSLRAIQKRALLSFYERHQPGSAWRSEPQLSPPPRPPPIPSRPRLPTPLSRRSSVSSEYDAPAVWNDVDCTKDDSSADEVSNVNSKEFNKNQHRSSSCGSLSTATLGPMVLGPSISIDDWVPELPPKKKQTASPQQHKVKREACSPDLPPPPPPPTADDERLLSSVADEPLPPPPPPEACAWPEQPESPPTCKSEPRPRYPRDGGFGCADGGNGYHRPQPQRRTARGYPQPPEPQLQQQQQSNSLTSECESPRPRDPATFGRSSSARRSKLTIPNGDYCRSEFSARKSVFQSERPQVVTSAVKPPAFSATATVVRNVNVVKHQICKPLSAAREPDCRTAAGRSSPSPVKSPSIKSSPVKPSPVKSSPVKPSGSPSSAGVVGPIKTSGAFPPSLEPSCPPTLYQQSQSKASYLSAYKREPREREKGLPNFEGSYKRTASPNSDGRAGDAAVAVEEPLQDVENVAPAAEGGNVSDSSRGDGVRLLQQSPRENLQLHNCTATSQPSQPQQQQQQQQQSLPSKQQQQQQQPQQPTEVHSSPAVLAERPTAMVEQQQQQQSKTLPRANNSAGQDFKRSSRAPRAQSDPSNMPNKADAAIACTLHDMMMMPPSSRHSESASSLLQQKRSQSDLSHMGSTESGYSSLSLNAPSPSHSPTRLSSGDFAGPPPPPPAPPMHPHPRCAGDSSYHHAPAAATPAVGGHVPEPAAWRRPVSLSCSTASSSDVVPKREQPLVPRGHMSPEEIECEELSRDLVSHLSPSDKLLNILAPGPDVKRSTDYVSPLFRMDLAPRSRTSVAEKLLESIGINGSEHNDVICSSNSSGLSPNSSYYTTSEPKAKLLNHFSRQRLPLQLECNGIGTLQKKKADLVSRLDRKLKVLRDEQVALAEETAVNETLGVLVADRVKYVAKPQEANKFRTHVQEVGHITSLLLSLSGRLARAENALLGLQVVDHPEKKALEEKKSKLTCQLEEAKELKDNIDRRGEFVSATLGRYLSEDEYSDYDHFIAMKAKLLIDAREIADKIQLGEEQLRALKETLEDF